MREIKFRQWIPPQRSYPGRMKYGIGASEGCWTSPEFVTWETYPIMQFTGLLDKNGKEIWEGDILAWTDPMGEVMKPFKVEWSVLDSCIPVEVDCGDYDYSTLGWAKTEGYSFEVIGNIHENPDLLKGG